MSRFYSSYDYDRHGSNMGENDSMHRRNLSLALSRPSYEKWDIVMVEFGQEYDCCLIRDYRPAIVYSDTEYNRHSPIMHVIPLTKRLKGVDRDYHVFVDKNECKGYDSSGIALIEQMRPMDRRFVNRKIGEVVDVHMHAKIEGAVIEFLGLRSD